MHLFISACALSHPAVDHVAPQPGESLLEAFECWQEAADKKACCDYSLHVDVPQWNDAVKDELELLVQEKGGADVGAVSRTMGADLETIWPKLACSCRDPLMVALSTPSHVQSVLRKEKRLW